MPITVHDTHGQGHFAHGVAFIIVNASLHDENGFAFQFTNDKAPDMSVDRGDGEVGQVIVGDVNWILDRISQPVKPGAENDSHNGLNRNLTLYRLCGFVYLSEGNIILHALFLIPGKLNIPYVIESGLIFAMLGILSFSAALSLLIVSILSTSRKRAIFVKVSALALLFIFSVVYWQAGNYLEGVVLAFTGLMLLILLTPFSVYLSQINLLNLVFVLIGFTNGIILAVSNAQYAQYDLVNYKTFLVIGFLVTALAGAIVTIVPSIKYGSILTRLQIIPWLGWCFIFMPVVPLATLIIPFLVVVAILMNGILPWEYLKLSKEDVLGRRTIMITATLELVVLLFIGAILLLLDNALNENFISISTLRDISFLFFSIITVIVYYEVFNILITINGLLAELKNTEVVVGNSQHFEPWELGGANIALPEAVHSDTGTGAQPAQRPSRSDRCARPSTWK
jgi:hypothetical protein